MISSDINLINFIDLPYKDKLVVLHWRNNENVRKWMYHSSIISEKEHVKFIEDLKHDDSKKYFLVSLKKNILGVIYFININYIDKHAEFGLYANPILKGNGKVLLKTICEYGFNHLNLHKIIAEVFEDNKKAIQLYTMSGFQRTGVKRYNKKNIISMEITK